MANKQISNKHVQINKANTTMFIFIAVGCFVVVFSLFASKALLSQRTYNARVIAKREKARDQLKENIDASKTLMTAYQSFVSTSQNVIGGNPNGKGDKDGDNAKIILDALPSKYDFPALTTSLEKILSQSGVTISNISGNDDEVSQAKQGSASTPKAIEIPFEANVTGNYGNIKNVISVFERSIRPFEFTTISFSGSDDTLQLSVKAKTYYQPAKDLSIKKEVVK